MIDETPPVGKGEAAVRDEKRSRGDLAMEQGKQPFDQYRMMPAAIGPILIFGQPIERRRQ